MKRYIKLLVLPLLTFLLVACTNEQETPVESAPEETTEQVEESVESIPTEGESVAEETSETEDGEAPAEEEGQEEEAEVSEDAVQFIFYVSGQEEAIAEFAVEDAEGMSVLDAMSSIEELDFTFNEVEGVIDVIEGYENDYEVGNTWTYLYNEQYAQLGVVSQTLTAGDTIEWYYGTIDEIPVTIIPEEGF